MSKSLVLAAFLSIAGLNVLPAFADDEATACSLATLHGTYGFASSGTDSGVPYTSAGRESYDGQGNIKYEQLWNEAGITYAFKGTGTYTMTPDCVATLTYDNGGKWKAVVAPDGGVFFYNDNIGNPIQSSGREERISRALLF